MAHTDTRRRVAAVLAAACLVAASICVSSRYLIAAVLLSGRSFASDATRDAAFDSHLRYSAGLLTIACLMGLAALVLAAFALVHRPSPA
jgi:hypothetical protein